MKLFWHIGPHKTGTTSLENGLARQAGARGASYYYPPVNQYGPGHAQMAWRLLGLNGTKKDPTAVAAELDRAARDGFNRVVISSEEFSRALMTPDGFAPLGEVAERVDTELILTLRPIADRMYPEVQELVKHGRKIHLANPGELLAVCAERPGLRPDLVSAAIFGMRPAAVTVILVDRANPQKLFDAISVILGETIPAPPNPQENPSYPLVKTAWLEAINRYGGKVGLAEARNAVNIGMAAASKELEQIRVAPYPPIAPPLKRYLDAVWELQLALLRTLEADGRVRIL